MTGKSASYNELIDHIVNKHHRYLNEELPQLSPYVTKSIACSWSRTTSFSSNSQVVLSIKKTELEQHIIKEETEDFSADFGI
ncbi:hypothetical protein GCM10020331_000010 [Ectobacillus funiculus]